ncbi:MAG: hypothetical protein GVY06_09600 [Alphaproteobacteria bacterium]|jgi:hypothetical protein|nr:hypothetical protein [Alphaproteobacteria bacterium]
MLADLGRLARHGTIGLLRLFTLKDGHGQARWILSALIYAAIGGFVAFAFLAGVIFRGTPHFETLRERVRLIAMAAPQDPAAAWQSVKGDTLALLTDSARLILIRPKSSRPDDAGLTVAGY